MYQTIYYHSKKHGWQIYKTKSLTSQHKYLCDAHQGKTYKDAQIYTHVCPGMPMDKPMIAAGVRIDH